MHGCGLELLLIPAQHIDRGALFFRKAAPPVVIFTTAYNEHALKAFEVNAVDYLVKPVRAQRLLAALAKVPRLRPVSVARLDKLPASARRFLS